MKTVFLFLTVSLLLFISCNKEDSDPTSTVQASVPTLSSPANNSTNIPSSPILIWNASSGATGYTIQVSANISFSSFVLNQSAITDTSVQVLALSNNTVYYWRVSATINNTNSDWSTVWTFTTGGGNTVPSPPVLSSPANGATNVSKPATLIWNASIGAASYTLQVSANNFSTYVYDQSGLTVTSVQVGGLNSNTKYYWRVFARNSYGTSTASNTWSFTTAGSGGSSCAGTETVTYGGKTYNTVQIGNQCWLKENLDVGTMINGSAGGFLQTNNGIIEKYCYDNTTSNCDNYGGLYEWPEAMQYATTAGAAGICPTNWHIPTYNEFQTLITATGNNSNSLKAVGQGTGNNSSGFSALLGGYRYNDGGFGGYLGGNAYFWSSTEWGNDFAYSLELRGNGSQVSLISYHKPYGFSIRCLKD